VHRLQPASPLEVTTVPKEVRERRLRVHELLVTRGLAYNEVLDRVSDEFDVSRSAVENDISTMQDWVGEIDWTLPTGEARILELRQTRQRLYEMAREAREQGDRDLERKLLRDILKSITTDIELCQSLGLTETPGEIDASALPEDEEARAKLAERDPAVASTSR